MKRTYTIGEVVTYLDSMFHPEYQEDYDNAGFLLGDSTTTYTGALVALDLTPKVIDEALQAGDVNLIVTHHPFIFSGLKRITDNSEAGRMVIQLVKNGISVYAAHTNLDNLPWGVNGVLAEKLGIINYHTLRPVDTELKRSRKKATIGAGMIGAIPRAMKVDKYLQNVKKITNQPSIRTSTHNPKQRIHYVAICGGTGSFLIDDAIAAGADLFITADLKYHDFQRAEDRIILADVGHYETEQFAKEIISRVISEKFSNFACRISDNQRSLVQYI